MPTIPSTDMPTYDSEKGHAMAITSPAPRKSHSASDNASQSTASTAGVGAPVPAATEASPIVKKFQRFAQSRRRYGGVLLLRIALLITFIWIWEGLVNAGVLDELYVSKPSSIGASFVGNLTAGTFLDPIKVTLFETLVGFAVATVLGVIIAVVLHQIPLLNDVLRPFLTAFNNLPRLALAPLFVLWFGLASLSKIMLVISLVTFIIIFNTYAGLQNASRDHLLLAKTLGANQFVLFRKFVFPSAVPAIFAGLQLALTYAFLAAVIGEMLSGSTGMGAVLQRSLSNYQTDLFFAGLLLLIVIATGLSTAMVLVERYLLRWQRFELKGLR